jgi:chromate transporter
MLPGFLLMLALSIFYVSIGLTSPVIAALFAGAQAGVVALVVRAVHRIGSGALSNGWLLALAAVAAGAELAGVHFAISLALCGIAYVLLRRRKILLAFAAALLFTAATAFFALRAPPPSPPGSERTAQPHPREARAAAVLGSGFKAGLLTFGGAYTAIPFVRHDAVEQEKWLTDREFLDGLALGGILPAPLIIFGTFVGYLAGGLAGAFAMTIGIFLPAFTITLVGHETLERIVQNRALHDLLDGITAGVVGLIAATTVHLFRAAVHGVSELLLFSAALVVLYIWKSKAAIAVVVIGAALLGLLL